MVGVSISQLAHDPGGQPSLLFVVCVLVVDPQMCLRSCCCGCACLCHLWLFLVV